MMSDADKYFHYYEPANTPWKWCVAFLEESELKDDLLTWCTDTFGEPAVSMYYHDGPEVWHDAISYGEIYLKSDEELTMFKLKWDHLQ